jgi:hypothetical protein
VDSPHAGHRHPLGAVAVSTLTAFSFRSSLCRLIFSFVTLSFDLFQGTLFYGIR